jgi:hypothetical protein
MHLGHPMSFALFLQWSVSLDEREEEVNCGCILCKFEIEQYKKY